MSEGAIIFVISVVFVSLFLIFIKVLLHAQEKISDPPVNYEKIDKEWQVETTNGKTYRSNDHGILWYSFPDGYRAELDQEDALEEGLERHKRLEKWSKP